MQSVRTALPQPVYPLAAIVALAGLVCALATGELGLLALLAAAPLAMAAVGSVVVTAATAAAALAVAALAGIPYDELGAAHVAALIAVAVAGLLAIALAAEFENRDRQTDSAAFLADASTLLSCSLDFDVTAKAVASVPVPALADWCLVELVTSDGAIERRAASRPDEWAEQVAAAVAAAGEAAGGSGAELWRDLPPALLDTWAQGNEERLGGMRAVGASSALRLPLRTLERRLGTMTLLGKQPRPPFSERDLHQAEELAARCSLAIENAHVYRAARRPSERRFTRRTDSPAVPRPEPGESR